MWCLSFLRGSRAGGEVGAAWADNLPGEEARLRLYHLQDLIVAVSRDTTTDSAGTPPIFS